jgi:TolA-binding protein
VSRNDTYFCSDYYQESDSEEVTETPARSTSSLGSYLSDQISEKLPKSAASTKTFATKRSRGMLDGMREFAREQIETRFEGETAVARVQMEAQRQIKQDQIKIESKTKLEMIRMQLEQQERTEARQFEQRQMEMQHAEKMAQYSVLPAIAPASHFAPDYPTSTSVTPAADYPTLNQMWSSSGQNQ